MRFESFSYPSMTNSTWNRKMYRNWSTEINWKTFQTQFQISTKHSLDSVSSVMSSVQILQKCSISCCLDLFFVSSTLFPKLLTCPLWCKMKFLPFFCVYRFLITLIALQVGRDENVTSFVMGRWVVNWVSTILHSIVICFNLSSY